MSKLYIAEHLNSTALTRNSNKTFLIAVQLQIQMPIIHLVSFLLESDSKRRVSQVIIILRFYLYLLTIYFTYYQSLNTFYYTRIGLQTSHLQPIRLQSITINHSQFISVIQYHYYFLLEIVLNCTFLVLLCITKQHVCSNRIFNVRTYGCNSIRILFFFFYYLACM